MGYADFAGAEFGHKEDDNHPRRREHQRGGIARVDFTAAQFGQGANFTKCGFLDHQVDFTDAAFEGLIRLTKARFEHELRFRPSACAGLEASESRFRGAAWFDGIRVTARTTFDG
jgi:hypothetical protein